MTGKKGTGQDSMERSCKRACLFLAVTPNATCILRRSMEKHKRSKRYLRSDRVEP